MAVGRRWHATPTEQQDLTPARILKEPMPAFAVEHQMGPVMVTVDYQIDPCAGRRICRRDAREPRQPTTDGRPVVGAVSRHQRARVITSSITWTNRGPTICGASIASPPLMPICASGAMRFISAASPRKSRARSPSISATSGPGRARQHAPRVDSALPISTYDVRAGESCLYR